MAEPGEEEVQGEFLDVSCFVPPRVRTESRGTGSGSVGPGQGVEHPALEVVTALRLESVPVPDQLLRPPKPVESHHHRDLPDPVIPAILRRRGPGAGHGGRYRRDTRVGLTRPSPASVHSSGSWVVGVWVHRSTPALYSDTPSTVPLDPKDSPASYRALRGPTPSSREWTSRVSLERFRAETRPRRRGPSIPSRRLRSLLCTREQTAGVVVRGGGVEVGSEAPGALSGPGTPATCSWAVRPTAASSNVYFPSWYSSRSPPRQSRSARSANRFRRWSIRPSTDPSRHQHSVPGLTIGGGGRGPGSDVGVSRPVSVHGTMSAPPVLLQSVHLLRPRHELHFLSPQVLRHLEGHLQSHEGRPAPLPRRLPRPGPLTPEVPVPE